MQTPTAMTYYDAFVIETAGAVLFELDARMRITPSRANL